MQVCSIATKAHSLTRLWNASGIKAAEQFAIASLIQAIACG
jgi:hypothetical protein